MSDLISRQAAIDALSKAGLINYAATGDGNGMIQAVNVIKELPSAQPEQRWIPCSERLPEEKDAGILKKLGTEKKSEYVLATVEVKGERMTVTACTHDGKWDWNMKYAFPDFNIVAWMPLPEPWKGGRE